MKENTAASANENNGPRLEQLHQCRLDQYRRESASQNLLHTNLSYAKRCWCAPFFSPETGTRSNYLSSFSIPRPAPVTQNTVFS